MRKILFSLIAFVAMLSSFIFSSLACNGKPGTTGPAGQPVTILVTATPSTQHVYLGQWGTSGSANGQFSVPHSVVLDGLGNLYVADTDNNRIQKFTPNGDFVAAYGSSGVNPGQFNWPFGEAFDAAGDLFVSDWVNNRLQELPVGLDGTVGTNWVTIGGTASGTNPGQFSWPFGEAFDAAGDLFVADYSNNRLQELPTGMSPTVSGNWVTFGISGNNPGQFNGPTGLVFDKSGNLYEVDQNAHRVQKLPAGMSATVSGNWVTMGGTASGTNPGQFDYPTGATVDAWGDLYVADQDNNRLQELPAGKNGTVGANWVTFGSLGSNPGQFDNPNGMVLDSAGDLYVADSGNNRIQKFGP